MKTLYDRLKPELKEALELEGEKYPSTLEVVKNSLIKNEFWTDLKVIDAMRLCVLSNVIFSIDNLLYCFKDEE